MEYLVLTFDSVNHTMMTEKKLLDEKYNLKTIPTPREISSSCGLAIRMDYSDYEIIKKLKKELPIKDFWKLNKEENKENTVELL